MDSRLYEVKLAGHKLFKDLQETLSENSDGKLVNLLELKDDVLYVWNPAENCLMSLNLKRLEETGDETPYQTLHMLSTPAFTVERVMASACGSRICVWGSRGVSIVELPSRWGRGGLFDSGNQTVLCKSCSLDERFLYSLGEIRRVHWHPSSLSHLLVLVSDNTIRLYNIGLKSGPKLVKIFHIGPKPSSQIAGRKILDSLGDTAVDFTVIPNTDSLLMLRGNGDVYMMQCELDGQSPPQPKVIGPLAMCPPADDNYGTDSCSITALGGSGDTPPLVVVATSSASLYHCLLLPNAAEQEGETGDSHALYVTEAVELNMVLSSDDDEMQYSYPVHLYPCTRNTYACLHAGGVHTVTVPVLEYLTDFALADEAETESILSAMCSTASVARHLVCTSGSRATLRPPRGLALTAPPLPALLVLCADTALITRTLEPYDLEEQLYKEIQLRNPTIEQDELTTLLKERQRVSFTSIIHEILNRDVSQPILNVSKTHQPTPNECLEFVSQATLKLRGEYMSRQQRASEALARKIASIGTRSEQHATWLGDLQKELMGVQQKSAVLREKCVLADKHQEDLKYRCSAVIRSIRACSAPSPAERELLRELQQHAARGAARADQLQRLRLHTDHKREELQKWKTEYKKKDLALGKSHSDTIASILQQQTSQISNIIEETKLLKDQLSLV